MIHCMISIINFSSNDADDVSMLSSPPGSKNIYNIPGLGTKI